MRERPRIVGVAHAGNDELDPALRPRHRAVRMGLPSKSLASTQRRCVAVSLSSSFGRRFASVAMMGVAALSKALRSVMTVMGCLSFAKA